MSDPYQVLGISADCDDAQIRSRYLELVRRHTPEHDPEQFVLIRQAYESLRDLDTRLKHRLFEGAPCDSLEAIIEEVECRSPRGRMPLSKLVGLVKRR